MKKVVFLVRKDFFDKFGGDTYQIEQYRKHFSKIESDIKTIDEIDFKESYALYILTNVDRMADYLDFFLYIKKNNLQSKTVILPIHHNYKAISEYILFRYRLFGVFLNFFGGVFALEKAKGIYRSLRSKQMKRVIFHLFMNYKKLIKDSLLSSRSIIFIANGEKKNLIDDFSLRDDVFGESIVVRNGISKSFLERLNNKKFEYSGRKIDVIVCGRIEPRKNQISIIKCLADSPVNVFFVGDINYNNKKYADDFIDLINKYPNNFTYVGKVTPDEMVEYYLNSKLCISSSWFEVSSLVDIEASAAGCLVCPSVNGNSNEIVDYEFLIDPQNMDICSSVIDSINDFEIKSKNKVKFKYGWKDSSQRLEDYFLSLI